MDCIQISFQRKRVNPYVNIILGRRGSGNTTPKVLFKNIVFKSNTLDPIHMRNGKKRMI